MKNWLSMTTLILGMASISAVAYAQETMDPVEEEMATEETMLSLPEEASEQGRTSSAYGLETANQARQQGAEFGRARAEQAQSGDRPEVPTADSRPGGRP